MGFGNRAPTAAPFPPCSALCTGWSTAASNFINFSSYRDSWAVLVQLLGPSICNPIPFHFFFWNKAPMQVGSCMPFWQMQVRGKQAQSRKVQILAQHHQSWKVKLKSWKQAWTRNELLLKHDSCNQSREASAITTTTAAWKHAGNRDGQGLHGWCSYKHPQNGCLPKA